MASADVQYVAYLKAKFNLADADLLQVIAASQRGGYTPPPQESSDTPGEESPTEEEKAEIEGMDESYEEVVEEEEEYDEIIEYMDESVEEQLVTDTPDPSPTPAPAPVPMPLSNNDQIVEQSNAIVPYDETDGGDEYPDMRASTLKMPETIEPQPKTEQPVDVTQAKDAGAIVPAKSQAIVPVPEQAPPKDEGDEENAMVVAPPIRDGQQQDDKREENPIFYVVACLFLLLVIAAAVILILIFVTGTIPKWWEDDANPPTMGDYQPGNCNFGGQVQPNVLSQCKCTGRVSIVESSVQERYDILTTEFIVPTVYSSWNLPTESCEPANFALLWLSTGRVTSNDLDLLQRYIMAFLYYSTEGEQWTQDSRWLSEANVCEWFGLVCSNPDLARIQLVNNTVKGQVQQCVAYISLRAYFRPMVLTHLLLLLYMYLDSDRACAAHPA